MKEVELPQGLRAEKGDNVAATVLAPSCDTTE
jgi:hypothetical protein